MRKIYLLISGLLIAASVFVYGFTNNTPAHVTSIKAHAPGLQVVTHVRTAITVSIVLKTVVHVGFVNKYKS